MFFRTFCSSAFLESCVIVDIDVPSSRVVVVSSRFTTAPVSHGCWTLCERSVALPPICVRCIGMVDSSPCSLVIFSTIALA